LAATNRGVSGAAGDATFFGGLTIEEIAEVIDVSPRTVEREWTMARAWLFASLNKTTQGLSG
jgi:DNA-directed RNA polymerase specialized sigma24 family protein